jgi:hypothetical protein
MLGLSNTQSSSPLLYISGFSKALFLTSSNASKAELKFY